jgi:hypothetical protein
MVSIKAKNVMVAAIGGPKVLVEGILDAMETLLHMLYVHGLQGDVPIHTKD